MAEAVLWKSVEIIRQFMRWPIHWGSEQHLSAWTEKAVEFVPNCQWVRNVLKNLSTKDRVQRFVGQRDLMRRAGKIHISPVAVKITGLVTFYIPEI
jgi:hypothetical protein